MPITDIEQAQKTRIEEMLNRSLGAWMSLCFMKKNGEITTRCARAKKFSKFALRGGKDNLANSPTISFYDCNKKDFRSFRIENLISVSCGKRITFQKVG